MSQDDDDVERLLKHMHLQNFSYRTFRHNEPAPPLRVVRSSEAPRPAPPAAARAPESAPPQNQATAAPAAEPPVTLPVTGHGLNEVFDRLSRGSIADSAAGLDLNLHLPARPLGGDPAPDSARQTLGELFRRLDVTGQPGAGSKPASRNGR